MKLKYLLSLVLILCAGQVSAQEIKVSSKTNIKYGVLENGLSYFLYSNPSSNGKADFYLIQNVGAILEEDSQDGLAHFLEHMCFNGTETYKGREMTEIFDKKGLSRSINAFTGVDETVYFLKDIPTRDKSLMDQSLIIMRDWCDKLLLDPEAIENERPVIIEEMRTRRDLQTRISEQISPYIYNHTRYAERFIVGTPEIINNFKREELVKFYKDWYRTDLQTIVVIGDINVFDIEKNIKTLCDSIKAVDNPRPKTKIEIPDSKETYYVQVKDKEQKDGGVALDFRSKNTTSRKEFYKRLLVNHMFTRRVQEMMKNDSLNILSAHITSQKLAEGYKSYSIQVNHRKNRAKQAFTKLINLQKDVLENGFTQEEIDFIAGKMSEQFSQYSKHYPYLHNDYHIAKIKESFLNKTPLLSPGEENSIFKKVVKEFTREEIKKYVNELYSGKNKTIIIYCNGRDTSYLSKEEVEEIERNAVADRVLPATEEDLANMRKVKLVKKELTPGKVVKTEKVGIHNAEKWTLSNGATVIYKECNYDRNSVSVYARSNGGHSRFDRLDVLASHYLTRFYSNIYGIEGFSKKELENLFKTLNFNYTASIGPNGEFISSVCDYSSLDQTLQLLHAAFESPCFYKEEYKKSKEKLVDQLESIDQNFRADLYHLENMLKYGKDRVTKETLEAAEQVTLERLEKVYKDRFKDASNWTFYIVGGIGRSAAKKLAELYLGSISSTNSNETYITHPNPFPKGYNKKVVKCDMVDPQAGTHFYMNAEEEFSMKKSICYDMWKQYFQDKVQKFIRGKLNGSYSIGVSNYKHNKHMDSWGFDIKFECDPKRVEELNEALTAIIVAISENGMHQQDFNILKKKNLDQLGGASPKDNSYYMMTTMNYVTDGIDESKKDYLKNLIESIDLKYMNTTIMDFFKKANIYNLIFKPKAFTYKMIPLEKSDNNNEDLTKKQINVTGVVESIENGKDGYTALVKINEGKTFCALISMVNLEDNYKSFNVGDSVKLTGDIWKMGNENQLTVRKILK